MNNIAVNQHFISFRLTLKTHVLCILYSFSIYFCFLLYLHLCLQLLSSLLSREIHCNLLMLKSINTFKYIVHIVENTHCCNFFCEHRKLYSRHVFCKKKNFLIKWFASLIRASDAIARAIEIEGVPPKLSRAVIKVHFARADRKSVV